MDRLAEASSYIDKAEGHPNFSLNDDRVRIGRQKVIMIMKQYAYDYHEAKLKEELTKFENWRKDEMPRAFTTTRYVIDEYLKARNNGLESD